MTDSEMYKIAVDYFNKFSTTWVLKFASQEEQDECINDMFCKIQSYAHDKIVSNEEICMFEIDYLMHEFIVEYNSSH